MSPGDAIRSRLPVASRSRAVSSFEFPASGPASSACGSHGASAFLRFLPRSHPNMTEQSIMTTDRLRAFLGSEYQVVIRHTVEQAFVESLPGVMPGVPEAQA